MTSLLPPNEDAEIAALMAWLDCWAALMDRRYPPEDRAPPEPELTPKPSRSDKVLVTA
jgi:hypothetical protein